MVGTSNFYRSLKWQLISGLSGYPIYKWIIHMITNHLLSGIILQVSGYFFSYEL